MSDDTFLDGFLFEGINIELDDLNLIKSALESQDDCYASSDNTPQGEESKDRLSDHSAKISAKDVFSRKEVFLKKILSDCRRFFREEFYRLHPGSLPKSNKDLVALIKDF